MMECNREEAVRARRIALKKLEKRDFSGAQRVALQAQRLYPELENLSQLLTVCKVYCAAEAKINRQLDWYGILQVEVKADDTVIRKQYDELAFWLHPDKNTLPGAEAAFKLVSEANMILSDHVKRSRYDIKRETAGLSDITLGKGNGARHSLPYDCANVFWTVCPHCQKRFVYYQRNFLAICSDCGKNFFAFTLSEQAVPLRFLSVAPDNPQVSLQMVSCQLRGVPDQRIRYSELRSTGGSMDFEPTVDSTCTEEHITLVGVSGAHGKGSSETRSNVVQCSAVNQSHTLPSADNGATGSMMLESTASDLVFNQNFGSPNNAGSCHLQMFGKRKHDDCADSGHRTIGKRRSKDDSLSDANSAADKMYNDDVSVANTQAANHVSDTMESQNEENATNEGSQQKHKEKATYIENQTHGNPEITYDCTGSIRSRDSCNNDRQRKGNSLGDANSTDDKVCSDNVADGENQAAESVPSTLDSQDEENTTQEGSQQKNKKDGTYIDTQTHCNPVITYERSDFFDFGTLRKVNRIGVNQIWAIYDDHDSMPRNYAQINHVDASNNNVQLTWLEHNTTNLQEARWTSKELPVACGNFCLGETCVLEDPSMYLSHKVSWVTGKDKNSFEIYPKKCEIWAVYKESSLLQSRDTDNHQSADFDVVEVSDDSSVGIIIFPLVKIEGFVSLFVKPKDETHILIPASQLFRFSHRIPCYRTNGTEKLGVEGLLELDTAALPCDLATVFRSISLDSLIDLNKKKATDVDSVTYPNSEFYNFNEDRSYEKFERGQIWALYSSTDTFPNLYGWINKVEKEPFKVHLTCLETCPQGVDKHWLEHGIPVSCGKFVIRNSTTEHCETETCAFSHLVASRWEIGTLRQVNILPKVGEVWAIYKNWSPEWVPSSKDCPAEYAIGEIEMCTETLTLFAFLTKVDGHLSVFKHDVLKGALVVPRKENLRFSHRIPSFCLTKENGGKLYGLYELDPAAVPDVLL